jgi:peptide/nickel transport system permease protein
VAAFVLRRLGQTVIVLLIASIIVFALRRMIPGDPVQIIMGNEYSPEAEARSASN